MFSLRFSNKLKKKMARSAAEQHWAPWLDAMK